MTDRSSLDGFDPLASHLFDSGTSLEQVFEDASRRVVHNILKSYTGHYDLFSELLQNALDAVEAKHRTGSTGYTPKIWITIDIQNGRVRVADNGVGMSEDEFKFCLRPNVSFKNQQNFRGHKGVGATFIAYGYSFLKIQSKQHNKQLAATLMQGRQWAEDTSGTVPRPRFQVAEFQVPELADEGSGTCIEVAVGQTPGERPKHLGFLGAQNAEQWLDVLRIKTPLGGVYLNTPSKFLPTVHLNVRSAEGTPTDVTTKRAEYYYPHELPNVNKVQSIKEIQNALSKIHGDAGTKYTKLPAAYKLLDCIWDVWGKDELLEENSFFFSALNDEHKLLIERHKTIVYAAFLKSSKMWKEFHDEFLKLNKRMKPIIHGGLQIASDYMAQGDLFIIPLTHAIGYQANSHVIVHFTDGDPDLGRKTFQPELKSLAEVLAVRAVNTMKKFLSHMKPDTGSGSIYPDNELHEWKKNQEKYWEQNPLSLEIGESSLALLSNPQQEQDVVALFHELVGMSVLKGFRFFATSQSERYDSLFRMEYKAEDDLKFDKASNRLGITHGYGLPYTTHPLVLEYKYSFDSLVSDFEKEEKFAKQIDFVVCWTTGDKYKERFYLQSLLVGDEGTSRQIFGSTHKAFAVGTQAQPSFEVLILSDLLKWIQDPIKEEARQTRLYLDS